MIRQMQCLRKRKDLAPAEFRAFWNDQEFEDLLSDLVDSLGMIRYEKNLSLQVEATWDIQKMRGTGFPYDGVIEFWFDNAKAVRRTLESENSCTLREGFWAYLETFVDIEQSSFFFTES